MRRILIALETQQRDKMIVRMSFVHINKEMGQNAKTKMRDAKNFQEFSKKKEGKSFFKINLDDENVGNLVFTNFIEQKEPENDEKEKSICE